MQLVSIWLCLAALLCAGSCSRPTITVTIPTTATQTATETLILTAVTTRTTTISSFVTVMALNLQQKSHFNTLIKLPGKQGNTVPRDATCAYLEYRVAVPTNTLATKTI